MARQKQNRGSAGGIALEVLRKERLRFWWDEPLAPELYGDRGGDLVHRPADIARINALGRPDPEELALLESLVIHRHSRTAPFVSDSSRRGPRFDLAAPHTAEVDRSARPARTVAAIPFETTRGRFAFDLVAT